MSPATNALGTSLSGGGSSNAGAKKSGTSNAPAASVLGGVVDDPGLAASVVGGAGDGVGSFVDNVGQVSGAGGAGDGDGSSSHAADMEGAPVYGHAALGK